MGILDSLFGSPDIQYPTTPSTSTAPACGDVPYQAPTASGLINSLFGASILPYPLPTCEANLSPAGGTLIPVPPAPAAPALPAGAATPPPVVPPAPTSSPPSNVTAPSAGDSSSAATSPSAAPVPVVQTSPAVSPVTVVINPWPPMTSPPAGSSISGSASSAPAATASPPLPSASNPSDATSSTSAATNATPTAATQAMTTTSSVDAATPAAVATPLVARFAPSNGPAQSSRSDASSAVSSILPSPPRDRVLSAVCYSPRFRASQTRAHESLLEDMLDENVTVRMVTKDAPPVALVVPEGCDSVDFSYSSIEVNPNVGSDDDLAQVITLGEATIKGIDLENGSVLGTLTPGTALMVTVPWRAASFVNLGANHLTVKVVARFYTRIEPFSDSETSS